MARKQTLQPKYPGDIGGDSKPKARYWVEAFYQGGSNVDCLLSNGCLIGAICINLSNQKMLGGLLDSLFPTGLWWVCGVSLHIKAMG
jgi:hypothetical protein